jgi:hypothetical protein
MADETKSKVAPAPVAVPAEKTTKCKVLRPIELDGVLYLPEGSPVPKKPKSAGNGLDVKVDVSGFINLTSAQAAEMTQGQIAPIAAGKKT